MTLTEAAELLDVSLATVSRIASGDRRPSIELMFMIEHRISWPFNDQADEIRCDTYASEFKKRVDEWTL